jgi:hypothetical protein
MIDPESSSEDYSTYTSGHSGEVAKLTQEEIETLRELLFEDPEEFCTVVLPDKFPKKMPWVHKGLLAIITGRVDWLLTKCTMKELDKIVRHFVWKLEWDNPDAPEFPLFKVHLDEEGNPVRIDMDRAKYTEIIMPRGFSKTTLIGLAGMLYKILFQENRFIVYVSETATAAELQLGNVRFELSSNPVVQLLFGNLKPDRMSELKWTSGFLQTTTGIVATARGRGGQIRGLNVNGQRPDCILFDDVEDKESVRTDEQRDKTRDWCYSDMMPALPAMDPNATIIGLVLKNDPDWTSLCFGAIDRDGDPLWEDNMSLVDLSRKKKSYALAGMLSAYYREYESTIRGGDGKPFPGPFLYKPEWRDDLDAVGLACDPAISDAASADFFGLAAVGITKSGNYLLLGVHLERGVPTERQVDLYFQFSERYNCTKHGVETIAYQKALAQMIRREMFRRKNIFVVEEMKHGKTGKDERIKGILRPLYANGFLAHANKFPEYETQLLDYPDGKKDGPDVVAQAIKLLSPWLANSIDPDDNTLEEDEYEPLGNWRQH